MRNNYSNKSNKCNGRGPHCCKFNICNVRSIRRACTAVLPQLLQDFRVVQPVSYIFFITKNYSSKSISCDQLWQHWEIYLLTFLPSVEIIIAKHAHACTCTATCHQRATFDVHTGQRADVLFWLKSGWHARAFAFFKRIHSISTVIMAFKHTFSASVYLKYTVEPHTMYMPLSFGLESCSKQEKHRALRLRKCSAGTISNTHTHTFDAVNTYTNNLICLLCAFQVPAYI